MIKELVLRINLEYFEEESRETVGEHLIKRSINTGVLAESDKAFFLEEGEKLIVKVIDDEDTDSTD